MFKRSKVEVVPEVSEFRQARSMDTPSIHIEKEEGHPLCGSLRSLYGDLPITRQQVLNSIKMQHRGRYWCANCGSIFTGEPKEFFQFQEGPMR